MNDRFLETILSAKRRRVDAQKQEADIEAVRQKALAVRSVSEPHRFLGAFLDGQGPKIIAEIKRASPSKGVINADVDVQATASAYKAGGASAISVLTEEDFFHGSIEDLRAVRSAVDLPILRKDFIVDEFQIYESAAAGADAILLIAAALSMTELAEFLEITREKLRMDALVEVHLSEELASVSRAGADIIGVNNRDLRTFEVSLDVSRRLIIERPPGTVMVAESGISTREEIEELHAHGFDGFLIGEALMRSRDAAGEIATLASL